MEKGKIAQVFNFIIIDNIDGKSMNEFTVEKSRKRKGLFAPKVEIILLEPGLHTITAHGKTYQTSPATIDAEVEAGKNYCLGASEYGIYLEERSDEWAQR